MRQIGGLLYSRIDSGGLISAVNDAFARVSGRPAAQLAGQMHPVLRDPQAPAAIHSLLRRRLGDRLPAATYLCDRAQPEEDRWSLAIILPVSGGFILLQAPPMAPIFSEVPEIYHESLVREAEDGADPDRSIATLRRLALARGFPGYDSFMACAMAQELTGRGLLAAHADPRPRALSTMTEALTLGQQGQAGLIRSFEGLQLIPNNMQIVASRLEPTGGPVSAIAENYRASSLGVSRRLQAFVGDGRGLCELAAQSLSHALIVLGGMRMLQDVAGTLRDQPAECRFLESAMPLLTGAADQAIGETIAASARVGRAGAEIRRHMLALDTIRVLGRVECCRMQDAGGLAATLDQLDLFHTDIRTRLEEIVQLSEVVGTAMGELRAMALQPIPL